MRAVVRFRRDQETKLRVASAWDLKYILSRVAEIVQDTYPISVLYYENPEQRGVRSMAVDMVVSANACSAPKGVVKLAQLLGVELAQNSFVKKHPNKPLDGSVPGIFACGCAEGPKDIPESVVQASSDVDRAAEG